MDVRTFRNIATPGLPAKRFTCRLNQVKDDGQIYFGENYMLVPSHLCDKRFGYYLSALHWVERSQIAEGIAFEDCARGRPTIPATSRQREFIWYKQVPPLVETTLYY